MNALATSAEVRCPLCKAPCTPNDITESGACIRCHEDGADAALPVVRELIDEETRKPANTN